MHCRYCSLFFHRNLFLFFFPFKPVGAWRTLWRSRTFLDVRHGV
jgi:hypothetical protein